VWTLYLGRTGCPGVEKRGAGHGGGGGPGKLPAQNLPTVALAALALASTPGLSV
jgi:hypothetical protein